MLAMYLVLFTLLAQAMPTSDPTTDWLLNQPAPAVAPATAPSTQPAAPFGQPAAVGPSGTVTLSDGTTLTGTLSTTPGKPLRFWVEEDKQYVDVTLGQIKSMQAEVVWERDEPEWQYAASGQDQKVYTGKTYPARETAYHVTLQNGDTFLGSIAGPLRVTAADGDHDFILHKRDKGDVGTPVGKLVFVKSVSVGK